MLKNLNESSNSNHSNSHLWHLLLLVLMVSWVAGSYLYLNHQSKENKEINIEETLTNLFPSIPQQPSHLRFRVKEKYEIGEIVFVKFFRIQAVIIEPVNTENYVVLYRDRNYVLQRVTLPKEMLLVPPDGIWNTFPLDN